MQNRQGIDIGCRFRLSLPGYRYVSISCALAVSLLSSVANAQVAEPRPTVTRATDLVLEYPSRVPLSTDVVFKQRNLAAANRLVQEGVQVRVFHLREGETRPSPISTVGNCEIYLTVVNRLIETGDGGLHLGRLNSGWIDVSNSGNSTKDASWFFVFEQVGAVRGQFRIKADSAADYFATGFRLTVFDNGSIPFDRIRREYEKRRNESATLYQEVDAKDPRIPCYSYKQLKASNRKDDLVAYGDVERCTGAVPNADQM